MAENTVAGGHDVHIDFHVTARGSFRHVVLSAEEARFDIGSGLSLYVRKSDIDALCAELTAAQENLDRESQLSESFALM